MTLDRSNGSYTVDHVILQWRLANNRRMSPTFGKVLNGASCKKKKKKKKNETAEKMMYRK